MQLCKHINLYNSESLLHYYSIISNRLLRAELGSIEKKISCVCNVMFRTDMWLKVRSVLVPCIHGKPMILKHIPLFLQ